MIRLFSSSETSFVNAGLGAVPDAISCKVTEERNGMFELQMTYPSDGIRIDNMTERNILYCKPNPYDEEQPFDIYRIEKGLNGTIEVYAEHASYRLSKVTVEPFTASSLAQTLSGLRAHAIIRSGDTFPFTFSTDKTMATAYKQTVPASIRQRLGGEAGSILDLYGGEYKWNKFNVYLYDNRGADRGVTIRYGKNLLDMSKDESVEMLVTGIYPYWVGTIDNVETVASLPEKVLYTTNASTYARTMTIPLDLSMYFDEKPTESELRTKAQEYISANNLDAPSINMKVSFIDLRGTTEYADIAPLEQVMLCDMVTIQHSALGVNVKAKVVKTVYDVLLDKYDSIELGTMTRFSSTMSTTSLSKTIVAQDEEIKTSANAVLSDLKKAIADASRIIVGQFGGNIQLLDNNTDGKLDALEILDDQNRADALDIFRWDNAGAHLGLKYTNGGASGTFKDVIRGVSSGAVSAWFSNLYANGSSAKIGQTVTGTNTVTSIAASTFTNIAQITLTKGTWVISGQIRMYTGFNGTVIGGISTTSGAVQAAEGGFTQLYTATALAQVGISLSRIITVTSASQTIYLVGWQNSGASKNLTAGQSHLQAVCVG